MNEMNWTTEPVTDEIAEWDGDSLSIHYHNWKPLVFYDMGFGLVGMMPDGRILVTSWRKPRWIWKFTKRQLRNPEVYAMYDSQQRETSDKPAS